MEKIAYYLRKSTLKQSFDRQENNIPKGALVFKDTISGTTHFKDRPQAKLLLEAIDQGKVDTVVLSHVDRLGRNTASMLQQLQEFSDKGINVRVENLGMDSMINGKANPVFKIVTSLLSSLSEYEKELITERRVAGVQAAVKKAEANGHTIYLGRKVGTAESKEAFLAKHKATVKAIKKNPEMSLRDLVKQATDGDYKPSPNTVKKVKEILERGVKRN